MSTTVPQTDETQETSQIDKVWFNRLRELLGTTRKLFKGLSKHQQRAADFEKAYRACQRAIRNLDLLGVDFETLRRNFEQRIKGLTSDALEVMKLSEAAGKDKQKVSDARDKLDTIKNATRTLESELSSLAQTIKTWDATIISVRSQILELYSLATTTMDVTVLLNQLETVESNIHGVSDEAEVKAQLQRLRELEKKVSSKAGNLRELQKGNEKKAKERMAQAKQAVQQLKGIASRQDYQPIENEYSEIAALIMGKNLRCTEAIDRFEELISRLGTIPKTVNLTADLSESMLEQMTLAQKRWEFESPRLLEHITSDLKIISKPPINAAAYCFAHPWHRSDVQRATQLATERRYAEALTVLRASGLAAREIRKRVQADLERSTEFNKEFRSWQPEMKQLNEKLKSLRLECGKALATEIEDLEESERKSGVTAMVNRLLSDLEVDVDPAPIIDLHIRIDKGGPLPADCVEQIRKAREHIKTCSEHFRENEQRLNEIIAGLVNDQKVLVTGDRNRSEEEQKRKTFNERRAEVQKLLMSVAAGVGMAAQEYKQLRQRFDQICTSEDSNKTWRPEQLDPIETDATEIISNEKEKVEQLRQDFSKLREEYNTLVHSKEAERVPREYKKQIVADQAVFQDMLNSDNPAVVSAGLKLAQEKKKELEDALQLKPRKYRDGTTVPKDMTAIQVNEHNVKVYLPKRVNNRILKTWLPARRGELKKKVTELKDQKPPIWETEKFSVLSKRVRSLTDELDDAIDLADEIRAVFEDDFDPDRSEFKRLIGALTKKWATRRKCVKPKATERLWNRSLTVATTGL